MVAWGQHCFHGENAQEKTGEKIFSETEIKTEAEIQTGRGLAATATGDVPSGTTQLRSQNRKA